MNIYKISNSKFKSIYISYNFTMEVKNTDAFSVNSVLGALMAKTSKKYNTQKEIEKYLNSLYGTKYDVNIEKYGDLYNLEFRMEYINKKFLPSKEELLDKVLEFLHEMIYSQKDWDSSMIDREKSFIVERINQRKDEKLRYGIQRAEEILCSGEPFGTYLYGEADKVEKVDKAMLRDAYKALLNSCVTVVVSGNLDGYENIETKFEEVFAKEITNNSNISELVYNVKKAEIGKEEKVVEYQDTVQSVLSMGLRINGLTMEDFYALNVYNAILGTTPSSKLFQNVREKESLAYTVRSRYYRFKEIIVIFAGINKENYAKAVEVINEQLEDMKKGNISEIEFVTAKDSLMADLLEWKDSKVSMAKMTIANAMAFKNPDVSIEEMRKKINAVTMEDVIRVANCVSVEKIFVLGGVENA